MKLYLAGPMRGLPSFNFPAFDHAADVLRNRGFEVFSPAERDREIHGISLEDNPTGDECIAAKTLGFSLRAAFGADTAWICEHADGIALLPGWEKSSGASAEIALARALGLTVIFLGKEFVQ